jgi:hypothetical protein
MGPIEIGVGVLLAVGVLVGVLFYVVNRQRTAVEGEPRVPSLPPERAARPKHEVVELRPGASLDEQLRRHAGLAEGSGLRPVFEVGAVWCPPSKLFGDVLADPRMTRALAGIYLIRADMDVFGGDPKLGELRVSAVPVFFELDADGQATGRSMTGAAWGADTVENMSAALAKFCA